MKNTYYYVCSEYSVINDFYTNCYGIDQNNCRFYQPLCIIFCFNITSNLIITIRVNILCKTRKKETKEQIILSSKKRPFCRQNNYLDGLKHQTNFLFIQTVKRVHNFLVRLKLCIKIVENNADRLRMCYRSAIRSDIVSWKCVLDGAV